MDFELREEQRLLQRMARKFLERECPIARVREMSESQEGFSLPLWEQMAQMGWPGMMVAPEYGGAGQGHLELGIVLEEMGRVALPSPFLWTAGLGAAVLARGSREQRERWLPLLAQGCLLVTLALMDAAPRFEAAAVAIPASRRDGRYLLAGEKLFVPYSPQCHLLVVAARSWGEGEDGVSVFLVPGEGLEHEPMPVMSNERQYRVRLPEVAVGGEALLGEEGRGWQVLGPALDQATALLCAHMVGGAQKVMEMTADYVSRRVQFGRPIGTFQAVRHALAEMYIAVEGARWLTYRALWALDQGLDARRHISIAKAWTSDVFRRATEVAHHLHGGIGVTIDYGLYLFTARAKTMELMLGQARHHRRRVWELS